MRSVLLENRDVMLAGLLYLPGGYTESEQYPAIVVADTERGKNYARRLADLGFVTLLFDGDGSGESTQCAIDYLIGLSFVDPARIGALGESAAGGGAFFSDRRIRAAARIPDGDADAAMNELTPFFLRRL